MSAKPFAHKEKLVQAATLPVTCVGSSISLASVGEALVQSDEFGRETDTSAPYNANY